MLESSARRFPDKEALVHGCRRLRYAELLAQVSGIAAGLRGAGVVRGDRVGIYVEASVEQVLAIFGVSKAGGAFVPINALLFPEQVAHIINDCRMRVLITTAAKLPALAPALAGCPSLELLVVAGEGAAAPGGIPV